MFTLPIRTIDSSDSYDIVRHDRIVSYVETMLSLHKQLDSVNNLQEKTIIQRHIEFTDRQIDQLVYEL